MTNLPITRNSVPASGNATNPAPSNSAVDDTQAATGTASSAGGAEPFAALLARQISGADSASLDATPSILEGGVADGSADLNVTDAQDPAAIITDTSSDAASSVMAMLMQLPQEPRAMVTNTANNAVGNTAPSASGKGKGNATQTGIDLIALDAGSGRNTQQELTSTTSDKTKAGMDISALAGGRQAIPQAVQDIVKPVELSVAQTSPMLSAVTPNLLISGKANDSSPIITTPLNSSGWGDEFSQKVSWMATQQNQVAKLHLNPPDLGPLDVVLKISDNQATALFTSPHGAVREAVENALPKLREMLADNGIMLGNATVSDQPPRDRDMEKFMGQGSGTPDQRGGDTAEPHALATAPAPIVTARRHTGMVDTFA